MKLHNQLSVTYETSILENGRVVKKNAPKRNLLLDSGLDGIADRSFWASFSHCVLGDGTTPTKRDSGAVTVSITGEVATASANYFESADVGRLLKLDSGQEVYISGFTSATEVAVAGASDDAASEATVWYVDESGHQNEIVRTSTLVTDTGANSTTWDGSTLEHKRTFLFPLEVTAQTYKEIGWSHTATAGQNLFGRDLIPGGGDSISAGQQYKVEVKLEVTPSPLSATAAADIGTGGWNSAGDMMLASVVSGFDGWTGGDLVGNKTTLEPHFNDNRAIILALADITLPGSPQTASLFDFPSIAGVATTKDAYTAGSRQTTFRATFDTTKGNGTIYAIGVGLGQNDNRVGAVQKLTTPQTKDSDHKLELAFSFSWGRVLTN